MNERIRELWLESAREDSGDKWDSQEEFIERFAQLIVRECAKVVDDMTDPEDSERYFWAMQNASTKIKQHFGVEE